MSEKWIQKSRDVICKEEMLAELTQDESEAGLLDLLPITECFLLRSWLVYVLIGCDWCSCLAEIFTQTRSTVWSLAERLSF